MIQSIPPPAIIKKNEELAAICQRAKHWADELRLSFTPTDLEKVKGKLARALENADASIRGFIDGECSIEHSWRQICAGATKNYDAFVGTEDRARELFEDHLNYLRLLRDHPGIRAMQEDGHLIPSVAKIDEAIQRTEEFRDRVMERWPLTRQEVAHSFPVDVDEVVYISPYAYIRSILAIVWNAFRHPFSTTYIDLSTGDSVTPVVIMDESES